MNCTTEASTHLCSENMVPVIPDVSADFYAFKTFDVRLFHSRYILHTQKTRHLLHKERTPLTPITSKKFLST